MKAIKMQIASTQKQLEAAEKSKGAYPMKGDEVGHYTQLLVKLNKRLSAFTE